MIAMIVFFFVFAGDWLDALRAHSCFTVNETWFAFDWFEYLFSCSREEKHANKPNNDLQYCRFIDDLDPSKFTAMKIFHLSKIIHEPGHVFRPVASQWYIVRQVQVLT